jgi:hypothetical protein
MTLIMLTALIALISITHADDFSSANYLNLSANEKMDKLWQKISENQTPFGFYSKFEILKIFLSDLWVTFNEKGDVMPNGRKKLIHTKGNIAKAVFIQDPDSPYTGIFKGSNNLLIRFSIAKEQDTTKTSAEDALGNFTPGISLKFLRNGLHSANLVAMFNTAGQNSWNPFKNDFTNVFNLIDNGDFTQKALAAKFASVTSMVSSVGVKDIAQYDESGKEISEPKFPFKLIFRPSSDVANKFPDTFDMSFTEQLKTITPGTVIYNVYAIDEPGCDEKKIGHIKITTNLITSNFGDEKLFFRHGLVDDDNVNKDWAQYRDSFSLFGGISQGKVAPKKSGCPLNSLLDL